MIITKIMINKNHDKYIETLILYIYEYKRGRYFLAKPRNMAMFHSRKNTSDGLISLLLVVFILQSDMANLLGVQMEAGVNPALKLGSQTEKSSANLKETDSRTETKKENEEQPTESVT